jgi:UbiD family decarboxylase
MPYHTLEDYVDTLDEQGELERIDEPLELDLEVGHLAKLNEENHGPALLFENPLNSWKDGEEFDENYRILTSGYSENERLALSLGLSKDTPITEVIKTWAERTGSDPIPPEHVDDAVSQDNVTTGSDVDVYDVPAPRIYELDGGPYLGTAGYFITQDPETGEVNLGTYRGMVTTDSSVAFQPIAGKDAYIHLEKYRERDEEMPIALVPGSEPLLFLVGSTLFGEEEYHMAGAIREEPVKVTEGVEVDLPVPAGAEWVLEGYVPPHDLQLEGPFGEYTGYHSGDDGSEKPYMRVEAITHKDAPIQNTCTVGPPITDIHQVQTMNRSAGMWKQLDDMNIEGLQSVYYHPGSTGRFICVASVDTQKPGHSTQVGTAMVSTKTGEYGLKIAIVVDDDINPANIDEVMWALSTRMRPEVDVQILERGRNTPLDPSYASSNREVLGGAFTGRLVIDATTPWEWPEEEQGILTELNEDVVERLEGRWSEFFNEPAEPTAGATAKAMDDD